MGGSCPSGDNNGISSRGLGNGIMMGIVKVRRILIGCGRRVVVFGWVMVVVLIIDWIRWKKRKGEQFFKLCVFKLWVIVVLLLEITSLAVRPAGSWWTNMIRLKCVVIVEGCCKMGNNDDCVL